MDKVDFLFCRERIILTIHHLITFDGHFTSLRKIAIQFQKRVQSLHLCFFIFPLTTFHYFQCHQTGRSTITHFLIVVMKHLVFAQFLTHDTQQVMAEHLTVYTLYNKRLITLVLHLSQLLTEFRCEHRFVRFFSYLTLFISLRQSGILGPHTPEHRLIDRLQNRVCCGITTLLNTIHSRTDRVRSNALHHLTGVQFCFQQLTVDLLLCGLLHNLLENLILRLREILILCLRGLLP